MANKRKLEAYATYGIEQDVGRQGRDRPCQLSKSSLTFPSTSFRHALNGLPDLDLNPFNAAVFPSRRSVFAVRVDMRLPEIVFQIVKPQPSRQWLQLNDFGCSTTCAPHSGQGPSSVDGLSVVGRLESSAARVFCGEFRVLFDFFSRPVDFPSLCSSP